MQKRIQKATKALQKNIEKAKQCPHRPEYHFLPPANWMNDPNGTIFHNGEYHLFYQFNPAKPKWGNLHWGHAKSKDLVYWEHLPIALAPDGLPKEAHCWSGCCVIADDGRPTIFYTSMNPQSLLLARARRYAQQWMATGSPDLVTWEKYPGNPILSEAIHGDQVPQHWRDPYVWKDDERWLMALCGQFAGEKFGRVFLYQSKNLVNWEYIGLLATGDESQGKGWECVNYFNLGEKFVLLISPYGPVIYSLGEFVADQHQGEGWHTFDHGVDFYATNTFIDDQSRVIVVGWVKAKGEGWTGCLSLPRQVLLDEDNHLLIRPVAELEKLRKVHQNHERTLETVTEKAGTAPFFGERMEIKASFDLEEAESFGFKLIDDKDEYLISFDFPTRKIQVFEKSADLQFVSDSDPLNVHIFIDHSVIEIFINEREAFTSTFYPNLAEFHALQVAPFLLNAKGKFTVDFWSLNRIGL